MQLSIVIPLLNEAESLQELLNRIQAVCEKEGYIYEIVFVDDGSTDLSWKIISNFSQLYPEVKGIKFAKNYGKSQALNAAFKVVKGEVIITMDADLQDFPEEIPALRKMIIEDGFDLVSGWKKKRYDNILTKNIPSKLFNKAAQLTSGVKLHDFNNGLKAYRYEVVKAIDVHGDMHRYIPVLAKNEGFTKITEKEVPHQARLYGKSKFGANRFVRGFLDLITVWFMSAFGTRPMHFFGFIGTLMFIIGFISSAWLGINKLLKVWKKIPAQLITNDPLFYIALTMMILGTLLFIAGFLGELIVQLKRGKKDDYTVSQYLNIN
ncbi:MAG: glycosyltransferase family 2 protein [Apibacter sp.]|jgi:glycosyltransferase involved in cell wall biosynthesis|uniref:Glycosyltransferase involved in cell wall bisynthesis n=1 Tax=Apibacter mensalis TaxID=1586267 RepID=A0A0X3AR04_9FLAO|nr:glycosyltransferase family 2 protein [Apibacter mensalis]MCO6564234.1 glycosyltransferase family 2 protein [Apibacter sp.]CVK16774.1 Glycosyltransferase involved in cell wall bisynthesis [Apibacter mensalis]